MRTSCSRIAFWSDSLQQLSEIAVTFQLQTCRENANPQHRGVVAYRYILGRAGSACHASDRCCHRRSEKERSHENVTSNHARSSGADFRRNCEPKSGYGFGADFGAGLVHKRLPTAAELGANRPTSRSVSHWGGRLVVLSNPHTANMEIRNAERTIDSQDRRQFVGDERLGAHSPARVHSVDCSSPGAALTHTANVR